MFRDYEKVQKYFYKLNELYKAKYGINAYEDTNYNKSVFEKMLVESDFIKRYKNFHADLSKLNAEIAPSEMSACELLKLENKYFNNLDINHIVDQLSEDDCYNILTLITINQVESYIIVRYDELGYFNNKTIVSDVFYTYDSLLKECRSIIIDIRDFSVVSLPFYKFRNLGECPEYELANIVSLMSKAALIEFADKLDGSFVQFTSLLDGKTAYGKPYILSSSGHLDPEKSSVIKNAQRYINKNPNYLALIKDSPEYTFMFELLCADSALVVVYPPEKYGLYLIGARNKYTGELVPYKSVLAIAEKYGLPHTTLESGTFDYIRSQLATYSHQDKEGYVINIDGYLVKMKCDDYLSVARLTDMKSSFNVVIERYVNGGLDDIKSLGGNLGKVIEEYEKEINAYVNLMHIAVNKYLNEVLNNPEINIKNANQTLKHMPRPIGSYVQNAYYSIAKNTGFTGYTPVDYLRTTVKITNLVDGKIPTINGAELRRRITELKKIV